MWGALIGAAIAGGVALYTEYKNSQAADSAKKEAQKAAEALKAGYDSLIGDVQGHYARTEEEQAAANEAKQSYLDMLAKSDSESFIENYYKELYGVDENGNAKRGEFEYDKEIADFMDPRAQYLSELAGRKASQQAGGQGLSGSYFAQQAFGEALTNKNEDLFKDARDTWLADRSQKYSEWNSYLQQKQNELSNLLTGQQNDLSNAKALYDTYKSEDDAYWNDLMNARIAALNGGYAADASAANTGNYTTDIGGFAQMVGAGANIGYKAGTAFSNGSNSSSSGAFDG